MCGDCGLHHSILDDPDHNQMRLVDTVCQVGAAIEQHIRGNAERDREFDQKQPDVSGQPLKKRIAAATKPHPADGRHTRLRWLTPDEEAQQPAPGPDD